MRASHVLATEANESEGVARVASGLHLSTGLAELRAGCGTTRPPRKPGRVEVERLIVILAIPSSIDPIGLVALCTANRWSTIVASGGRVEERVIGAKKIDELLKVWPSPRLREPNPILLDGTRLVLILESSYSLDHVELTVGDLSDGPSPTPVLAAVRRLITGGEVGRVWLRAAGWGET